jgi:prepilin-type N-terminal cleavage/methylation domain-containing protein
MNSRAQTLLRSQCGFSLIEVLFAIVIMGVGVLGILSLFANGLTWTSASQNTTNAAVTAQSLAGRIVSEVDTNTPPGHPFLDRIVQGKSWIQDGTNGPIPVRFDGANADNDLWWSCRASKLPMNPDSYDDPSKDNVAKPYPDGLYQIAVFVYRNYKAGKPPVAVYTTLVTAGY